MTTKPNIAALFDAFTNHRVAIQRAMGQRNLTQAVQDEANAALYAKLTEFGIADHFDWTED